MHLFHSVRKPCAWLIFLSATATAQQTPVGTWRDHLPYGRVIAVTTGQSVVYAATPHAVFAYNPSDDSVERLSKANVLSDTGISALAHDTLTGTLVVGYTNGNLDLIRAGAPFNLSDIKRSNVLGNKRVNNIAFRAGLAYLSMGFGVVVIDLSKQEVKDTYIIGDNGSYLEVNHIEFSHTHLYACTPAGILTVELSNPFPANFQNWTTMPDLPDPGAGCLFYYRLGGHEYVLIDQSAGLSTLYYRTAEPAGSWDVVHNNEAATVRDVRKAGNALLVSVDVRARAYTNGEEILFDNDAYQGQPISPNTMWRLGDNTYLIGDDIRGLISTGGGSTKVMRPSGPRHFNARRIDAWNDHLWVASGGIDLSWTNNFDKFGFYGLVNEQWQYSAPGPGLNEAAEINDIMDSSVDPLLNTTVAFGSWEEGLIMLSTAGQQVFNASNSTLKNSTAHSYAACMVAGVDHDIDGNLWVANSYSDRQLHMMARDGSFTAFNFQTTLGDNKVMGDLLAAQNGYVWMVVPRSNGLLVLNPAGTPGDTSDDDFRYLTEEEGNGGLPSPDIYCVEEDVDGEIWVGTLEGIAVFYTPDCIFSDEGCDAQQILIEQDGNTQILLATESVNVIKIDGANRKWVGTQGSGVFLLSEDGLTEIHHFTAQNSPLLSNVVTDIAINQRTGEVFFATDAGIIAYQGTATNFSEEITDIKVFPNPVTHAFEGLISMEGLAYKTDVKITDIAGNLVHKTISDGGRATWDGTNVLGEKVSSGVYLIFATNSEGTATGTGKIAILR